MGLLYLNNQKTLQNNVIGVDFAGIIQYSIKNVEYGLLISICFTFQNRSGDTMKKSAAILLLATSIALLIFSVNPAAVCAASTTETEILLNKGLLAYDAKKYQQAIDIWTQAIEYDPSQYKIYYNRGLAWYGLNQTDQAITDFTKAIEAKPDYAMAYCSRGFAWKAKADYDRAINDFTNSLTMNPDYYRPYFELGWIYAVCPDERYRNGDQAVMWASKAQELYDNPKTMQLLAAAYAENGEFDEAVSTQKKAIAWINREGMTNEMVSAQSQLKCYKDERPLRPKTIMAEEEPEEEVYAQDQYAEESSSTVSGYEEEPYEEEPYEEPFEEEPYEEPVEVAAAEVSAEAVAEVSAPAISGEYTGDAYPYVIQVSAYQESKKSNKAALELKKKGDMAFTAHAFVPGKGEWFRVFVGCYKTLTDAKEAAASLKQRRFTYADIRKKAWALSAGDFTSDQELSDMEDALFNKGYMSYRMTGDAGTATRLLIGAYTTPQQADKMGEEIRADGFDIKVVKR